MSKKDSVCAFPLALGAGNIIDQCGMELRDWLAGAALKGLLARASQNISDLKVLSTLCYDIADECMKQRKK